VSWSGGVGAFFYGVAFFDPVYGERIGDGEDAEALETHVAQSGERGLNVRAPGEGAASAIDNKIGGARNVLRPLFQIVDALRQISGAAKDGAGNVRAHEVGAEADADDDGLVRGFRICEFLGEIGGLDDLSGCPRI